MTRRRWLWLLGTASLLLFVVLVVLDGQMTGTGGPGIVGLELAWTPERASEILSQWGPDGREAARASLWLDYAYLAAYGAFFWLAVGAMRDAALRRGWARYARPGAAIALLAPLAAAADAVEDAFLLLVVGGHADSAGPPLAGAFATAKFVCLGIVWLYLVGGLIGMAVWRGGGRAARA